MYRKERKIPTLFAIFLILSGIGISFYLDNNFQNITSKASPNPASSEVHLTNITDNSITVSYLSDQPAIGAVIVSGENKNSTQIDDSDKDGKSTPRNTHMFTIKDLQPENTYKITIVGSANNCNVIKCPEFVQKTGLKLDKGLNLPPVSGQILDKNNKPVDEALIYLLIGRAAALSGRTDKSGMFVIPLNNLRNQDLLNRPEIEDNATIQITIKRTASEYASVVTNIGLIKNNPKLAPVRLGNTYNYLNTLNNQNPKVLGNNTTVILTPTPSQIISKSGIDIIFPRYERDVTIDNNPKLRGIGIAGDKIRVTVQSTPQSGTVTVNNDGTWEFRPLTPLPAGSHKITITGKDKSGKTVTVSRNFVVLKSGEAVLGESTPSGTISPTLSLSLTPTDAATISATPTNTPSPTLTPTLTPTETPSPTSIPVTLAPPPRSGTTGWTGILIGGGITLILLGIKLLF